MLAVFDSTYHNETVTGYVHGLAFARDIFSLLEEITDIFVIFKEKKNRIFHRMGQDTKGIERAYAALDAHPRCLMLGSQQSRSEIVSLADLTVSFPFTSTTLEALGACRKAIFYDPTGGFQNCFYAKIPGLTAHGYGEFKERVQKLLFQTTNEEYDQYLMTEIKEEIDPYLDGRAVTRFRELLLGSEDNSFQEREGGAEC